MESVFSEIFSFRVPGGEVSVQRRFELSPDWAEDLALLPIVADRSAWGTYFVQPADAVLLFSAGALALPDGGTYTVQFHGGGKYFDTPADTLIYCAKRWPVPFSLWRKKLEAGSWRTRLAAVHPPGRCFRRVLSGSGRVQQGFARAKQRLIDWESLEMR